MTQLDLDFGTTTEPDTQTVTHIVTPHENRRLWKEICVLTGVSRNLVSGPDIVAYARKNNFYVVALCSHVFIPMKNPDEFDMCDYCMKVAQKRMRENGE